MSEVLTGVVKPIGPHSEIQLIADVPADTTISLELAPTDPDQCYIADGYNFDGTDLDVFQVFVQHPDAHPHTAVINEGLQGRQPFVRPLRLTRDAPLRVEITNMDAAAAHHLEAIFYVFITTRDNANALFEAAIRDIVEYLRRRIR